MDKVELFPVVTPPTAVLFTLVVQLQFTADMYKQQFLQYFAPLAQYVRDHEPWTLSYEALLSDKDPLHVLILERYINKDHAYLHIHRHSKEFLQFRPKLQALIDEGHVVVSGHSYLDSNLGFIQREEGNDT
jgi:quinol monooxygenase YgiN